MSLVSNAIVAAYKAARSVNAATITITRPRTGETVSLSAVPGSTSHVVETDGMIVNEIRSRDFLVLTSEFVLGGSQTTPERGDVITSGGKTFKALAASGEQHWRYTDQTETVIRIFTKEA